MDTKRPFARLAARASAGCAVGALVLFVAPSLGQGWLAGMPEAYGRTLFTLSALGLCVCLVVSLAMGVSALWGLKRHGRSGILAPALLGLILSGLMMLPILRGLNAGMSAQARESQAPLPVSTNRTRTP